MAQLGRPAGWFIGESWRRAAWQVAGDQPPAPATQRPGLEDADRI